MTTIRVKPRPGIILAGIPAKGTDVERALAEEWLDNGLVTRVDEPKTKATPSRPARADSEAKHEPVTPAKEG